MPTAHPHEEQIRSYLAEQLGPRAPHELVHVADFDERPLEGEGAASVFAFELAPPPGAPACDPDKLRHFVAGGQTVPNYFPAYRMTAEEAYSFHIGTRFMLYMGVQKVADELEPPTARPALQSLLDNLATGATLEHTELAGLFRCEDDYFAVYRLRLSGEEVYCLAADCPPGFYRLTEYPPQMVLRLHLGNVIRDEARNTPADGD